MSWNMPSSKIGSRKYLSRNTSECGVREQYVTGVVGFRKARDEAEQNSAHQSSYILT